MYSESNSTLKAEMEARGDRPVLCLENDITEGVLRYAVGRSERREKLYSVYAECVLGEERTFAVIPAFSRDRELAERFCCLLERFGATPLSLEAVYEDTLTP